MPVLHSSSEIYPQPTLGFFVVCKVILYKSATLIELFCVILSVFISLIFKNCPSLLMVLSFSLFVFFILKCY